MSAESDLFAALSGAAAVTNVVEDRIFSNIRDQDTDDPAIVFERTDTRTYTSINTGEVLAERTTMAVTCLDSESREAVESLANSVVSACVGAGLISVGRDGAYDDKTDLYISTLLFIHNQG